MGRIGFVGLGLWAVVTAGTGFAADLGDPRSRAKAISAAASMPASPALRAELPELNGGVDESGRSFSGACAANSVQVCYDSRSGRLVIKGSRHLMPDISGLRAEHISVRKDRVQLQYSFR